MILINKIRLRVDKMKSVKLLLKLSFYTVCYVLFAIIYSSITEAFANSNETNGEIIELPDQEEIILPEGVFGHIKIAG